MGEKKANKCLKKKETDDISCDPGYMQHINPCLWEDGS